MKVTIPSIRRYDHTYTSTIITEIVGHKIFESELQSIKEGENEWWLLKDGGTEILVRLGGKSQRIEHKFRYLLKTDKTPLIQAGSLDLTECSWEKHPLMEESYLNKHDKEYIWKSWANSFFFKRDTDTEKGLRTPQIGALHALQAHWCISSETATIVLPTGTGKTETMISALIMDQARTLLIIVPTDALRTQLARKFITLGILPEFGVVSSECENPSVGKVKHRFKTANEVKEFFSRVNVAIATMNVIAGSGFEVLNQLAESVTHLFFDEAHHTPADTWYSLKRRFTKSRIVQFTATPFRNDGKRLDGKIIFNFPLRKAQEMGYFKPIYFKPVYEHDFKRADALIAKAAVQQLKADLEQGFDHIMMVRVNEICRANEILPYYAAFPEYNPVIVHSGLKPKSLVQRLVRDIVQKKHRIIICVDMLGEGFDLPELKIAAFHDTKRSLTITLQLAGRFTRAKANLGPATFIANTADAEVAEDLEDLYYKDSDWNALLPDLSLKMSLEQEDFRNFLEGFKGFPDKFPIQAIKNPLSTIIYQCKDQSWNPLRYKKGLRNEASYEYLYSDYNADQEVLVVILGKQTQVKWAKVERFQSLEFDLILCYFDKATRLLYLHASNTNSYYESFVETIAPGAVLLKGQNTFRCFHGINRLRLFNVGLREPMGRAKSYTMRVGSDIRAALRQSEVSNAIKSNIFGIGYQHESKVSIGCSRHGRIWSMRTNNIPTWMKWCRFVGSKITDDSIDPDAVLKGTLLPIEKDRMPEVPAFSVEWPDFFYRDMIGHAEIQYNNEFYPIWNCDLSLGEQSADTLVFYLELPSGKQKFYLKLFNEGGVSRYAFTSDNAVFISDGSRKQNLCDFFQMYPPLVFFIDGSFMEGNLFTEVTLVLPHFSAEKVLAATWNGINIQEESQTYLKSKSSIQYAMIQRLLIEDKYAILMDDDDKGELADIVGFYVNEDERILYIDLYHCKFSRKPVPGLREKDFYEVCSQAQKSIKWMEDVNEIFKHLLKRNSDRQRRTGVGRFEVGDADILEILKRRAKKDLKVKMNVFIVQPGLAKEKFNEESIVSKLLAAVESYLKETWNATLTVIANK